MAEMFFDDGLLDEPCLSCENARVEDISWEWYCDEKECKYIKERIKTIKAESEE